jgi:hypothetical protein
MERVSFLDQTGRAKVFSTWRESFLSSTLNLQGRPAAGLNSESLRGCQPKKFLVVPAHAAMEGRALTERGFRSASQLDWKSMH